MPELPGGTVTFLFTDVERSTQTVGELGDERYADLQDAHRKLLREAFAAHHGVEVGTEGDAFFVAFTRATDAVGAAVDGQRALMAGSELRVRMGLHTGEALVRGNEYVGHDVHKAKRISDAGHGGQILVSQTTGDLICERFQLIDLGPHRLKDLGEDQRVFQVNAEGLIHDFPPLRSQQSARTNLPMQRSSFIGRSEEIAAVRALIGAPGLITLTGIGGSGKTRLALQVAAGPVGSFTDGVYFCDLSAISSPELVAATIAGAVGATTGGGTVGFGARSTDEAVVEHLASRNCLIVIDNCEHLLDACAEMADRILDACPAVTLLATSREALGIDGERSIRVPSLSLLSDDDDPAMSEAVTLFTARAREVEPSFEVTAENLRSIVNICKRVDGIPLAIEFAASRIAHLSPRELDERLGESFRLLVGGRRRVQRQATIEATLDWSFALLTEPEKLLLTRSSVFAGSFTLRDAETVCAGEGVPANDVLDVLGSLVARSMVVADSGAGATRYRLLETVRLYAGEKLRDAGDSDRIHDRHRDELLQWLESIPWEDTFFDELVFEEMLEKRTNLFAALEWSSSQGRTDLVVRIGARLYMLWVDGEYLDEGYRWMTDVRPEDVDVEPDVRTAHLITASMLAIILGARGQVSLEARAVGTWDGKPSVVGCYALARRAIPVAVIAAFTGDPDGTAEARRLIQASKDVAEALPVPVAFIPYWAESFVESTLRNNDGARAACEKALPLMDRQRQSSLYLWCAALLVVLYHVDGDHERAARLAGELAEEIRPVETSRTGPLVAVAIAALQRPEVTRRLLTASIAEVRRTRLPGALSEVMVGVAVVAARQGDRGRASRLLWWVRASTIDSRQPMRSPVSYPLYIHYVRKLRDAMSADDAHRARDEGRAMTEDDVCNLAMEVLA